MGKTTKVVPRFCINCTKNNIYIRLFRSKRRKRVKTKKHPLGVLLTFNFYAVLL